MTYEKFTKAMV